MTLRLLCDEHVGDPLYPRLVAQFDAEHVIDVLGAGTADEEIWRYAVEQGRVVFTNDRDYMDGSADPGDGTHPGVVLYSGDAWNRIADVVVSIDRSMTTEEIAASGLELFMPSGWA